MNRIKNLEDAVYEALVHHSAVATVAAVHRAFGEFLKHRAELIVEGELPSDDLLALEQPVELKRRIGRTIAGMSDYIPQRRADDAPVVEDGGPAKRPDGSGLYVVDNHGELKPRQV